LPRDAQLRGHLLRRAPRRATQDDAGALRQALSGATPTRPLLERRTLARTPRLTIAPSLYTR
jgi:hypothetical protein